MKQTRQKLPQISAHVSEGTKWKLDRLSKTRGMRKAFVLEQALLYHFRALEELPEEAFLPQRLVLSQNSFNKILEFVDNPPYPTKAMQELMDGDRIRSLKKSDNRKEFESGQADLDHFFKRYAGQNQFRHHIGVTYIATNEESVFGYMTVAMGVLEVEGLPERKSLPGPYPLPILRLGRLAVDNRYQSQGIGKQLLRYALRLALQQKDTVGCVGMVVDAKPEVVEFYKKFGFSMIDDPLEGEIRGNPRPRPLFLPIKAIVISS